MSSASPTMRPYTAGNITGITLHIETHNADDAQPLTFYKSRTRSVNIGRRSTHSRSEHKNEDDRALFRCPVISRKHARITFTEYGNAYIMDLHSHHGTHILRPGEMVSNMISPEVPHVLGDGDIITFGKTVGKDESLVRPVTARVKLLFTPSLPVSPISPPGLLGFGSSPTRRSISGRYGVYAGPSEDCSSSDRDSDVEEISPPFFSAQSSLSNLPLLRQGLLKSMLPPIRFSDVFEVDGPSHVMPDQEVHDREYSPMSVSSSSPSIVEVDAPKPLNPRHISISSSRESSPEHDIEPRADPLDTAVPAVEHDLEDREEQGSLFNARCKSVGEIENFPEVQAEGATEAVQGTGSDESQVDTTPEDIPNLNHSAQSFIAESLVANFPDSLDTGIVELPQAFSEIVIPLEPNQDTMNGIPSSFDARMDSLKAHLAELEKRMRQTAEDDTSDTLHVSVPVSGEAPLVDSSEEMADALVDAEAPTAAASTEPIKFLKAQDGIIAMETLCRRAEIEMALEMEALRTARIEAEVAAEVARVETKAMLYQLRSEVQNTLAERDVFGLGDKTTTNKRKHSELDDTDCFNNGHYRRDDWHGYEPECPLEHSQSQEHLPSLVIPLVSQPTKRRRVMRVAGAIGRTVAKTVGIAAVGAIATWSALAFS